MCARCLLRVVGGSQLAIDVTLRSVLGRTGEAQPNAAATDGAVLTVDKETKNPEIPTSGRRQLGGCRHRDKRSVWLEVVDLVWQLAQAKSHEVSGVLRSEVFTQDPRWVSSCDLMFCVLEFHLLSVVSPLSLSPSKKKRGRHVAQKTNCPRQFPQVRRHSINKQACGYHQKKSHCTFWMHWMMYWRKWLSATFTLLVRVCVACSNRCAVLDPTVRIGVISGPRQWMVQVWKRS